MEITLGQFLNYKYLLITPVRDEEKYIIKMVDSILRQGVLPTRWIIIDDGSIDRTLSILEQYKQKHFFIDVLSLPRNTERQPGGEGVIEKALKMVNVDDYDLIARFDADIVLDSDYIIKIMEEFNNDPTLGIAGGGLYIIRNGKEILEKVPEYHVRGALKMYRRNCFKDIGGLDADIGWDTIDEVRAWMHGWKTRSFFLYKGIHLRPTGNGVSQLRLAWKRGWAEYKTCSHPLFVIFKSAKLLFKTFNPFYVISYLTSFLYCHINGIERIKDKEFIRYRREEQSRRIRAGS